MAGHYSQCIPPSSGIQFLQVYYRLALLKPSISISYWDSRGLNDGGDKGEIFVLISVSNLNFYFVVDCFDLILFKFEIFICKD